MRQLAWLDFHGGCWHLVTGSLHDPDRKWTNRESALSDLAWEGWTIDGPHGRPPTTKHDADRHFYGYALSGRSIDRLEHLSPCSANSRTWCFFSPSRRTMILSGHTDGCTARGRV